MGVSVEGGIKSAELIPKKVGGQRALCELFCLVIRGYCEVGERGGRRGEEPSASCASPAWAYGAGRVGMATVRSVKVGGVWRWRAWLTFLPPLRSVRRGSGRGAVGKDWRSPAQKGGGGGLGRRWGGGAVVGEELAGLALACCRRRRLPSSSPPLPTPSPSRVLARAGGRLVK